MATSPARRYPPAAVRAALMRAAGDVIGSEQLARALGVSSRTIYKLMAGKQAVRPGILADTRRLLIQHRQRTNAIIGLIRDEEERP